jgi:glycine dehydrogenase subunit 1
VNFLPNTERDREVMLKTVGAAEISDLFRDIPAEVRLARRLNLPDGLAEMELARHMNELAGRNGGSDKYSSFLGAGAYEHYIPSAVWHLAGRSEFYTAYTPYQAEISQGTLQAIYEYQTLICELTGMDVSNASLYDGASGVAEAAAMAIGQTRRQEIVIGANVHPEYRAVLKTYARNWGCPVREIPAPGGYLTPADVEPHVTGDSACLIVQVPNFFGGIEDGTALAELAHRQGALLIVVANPVALGLLKPPGAFGADICVGEGQPFGNPVAYGGPYLGFMACKEALVRRMPGRIVGATVDHDGRRGFVLTLQTREQHIRREKATSNICSNEALCALAATIHLSLLGKEGVRELAEACLQKAHYAQDALTRLPGVTAAFRGPFFHEFVIRTQEKPEDINRRLLDKGIIGGLPLGRFYPELADSLLVCVTETKSRAEIDRFVSAMGGRS